jgi:hypothetical protein
MNKACLLAAVSALALMAQGSVTASANFFDNAPKSAKILYNQNSNAADWGVNSQNSSAGAIGDAGADDFVVPTKTSWTVTEVDVTGIFYNGSGGGSTQNVIFYQDDHGLPGKAVKKGKFLKVTGTYDEGNVAIQLPGHGLSLKPGHYWVSVAVNCSSCGQWDWTATGTVHGDEAVWQQPKAKVCPTWGTLADCFGSTGDLMFDLRGSAKRN